MAAKHKARTKVTFMHTKCLQSSSCAHCVIISTLHWHAGKARTAVHFIANCYFFHYIDISIFTIFMHSHTHMQRYMDAEVHTSLLLQIDVNSWVGEWAFPVLQSVSKYWSWHSWWMAGWIGAKLSTGDSRV